MKIFYTILDKMSENFFKKFYFVCKVVFKCSFCFVCRDIYHFIYNFFVIVLDIWCKKIRKRILHNFLDNISNTFLSINFLTLIQKRNDVESQTLSSHVNVGIINDIYKMIYIDKTGKNYFL